MGGKAALRTASAVLRRPAPCPHSQCGHGGRLSPDGVCRSSRKEVGRRQCRRQWCTPGDPSERELSAQPRALVPLAGSLGPILGGWSS